MDTAWTAWKLGTFGSTWPIGTRFLVQLSLPGLNAIRNVPAIPGQVHVGHAAGAKTQTNSPRAVPSGSSTTPISRILWHTARVK